MYKILLADDEGIVTDALQFIIEKNFGNECEIAVAKNGRQAIELTESFQPDIAFLDIQMPGINGLKAMKEIREQNSRVKIIVLTAYDNFEYAKDALHLGAEEYLLKPINKKVIVERLTALMREIDQSRKKRSEDLKIKEKMEAVVPIIENGFLISLLIQNEFKDVGEKYLQLLNIEEKYGIIMVLEWGSGREGENMGNPVGSGVLAHRYYNKMAEMVKMYFNACVSNVMGNKLICAIMSSEADLEYEERLNLIERARNLNNSLKKMLGIDFRAGSGSVRSWEDMSQSYQEALNALHYGMRKVTHIDDLIVKDEKKQHQKAMEQIVLKAVAEGNEQNVRREAAVFAGNVLKNSESTLDDKKMQLAEVLLLSKRIAQEKGAELSEKAQKTGVLLSAATEEEIYRNFLEIEMEIARLSAAGNQQENTVIAKAKEYIQKNFKKDDLALEEVAQAVGISPYYFSKLFKEEMKQNYSEYLTDIRIEKARELLLDRELSIKQVCVDSGYSNPNYFSRIFKKWTGLTPTEFRDGGSFNENN